MKFDDNKLEEKLLLQASQRAFLKFRHVSEKALSVPIGSQYSRGRIELRRLDLAMLGFLRVKYSKIRPAVV